MVVGAHSETDKDIILMADRHYKEFKLKRVYFSGYIPINPEEKALPAIGSAPPLLRENRLYQSDWLMRFMVLKQMKLWMTSIQIWIWILIQN